MDGTIKSIGRGSGTITTLTEGEILFNLSSLLSYDLTGLAVGQQVTFDLREGSRRQAENVVVQHHIRGPVVKKKEDFSTLRYAGFEQNGCRRLFRFEQVVPGTHKRVYVVDADMGLFRRHRISLQEGPGLCFQLLAAEMVPAAVTNEPPSVRRTLTDRDMEAHLAKRPAPRAHGPQQRSSFGRRRADPGPGPGPPR